ncbi:MAG: Glyoxylate/hydroxypyruvate reductase B [Fimbriimonadaceae bacterium]|nr:Glyoxylate/hydroxypyruvate reductase B [Fimbriimonadaceae bacterium]
MSIPHVSIYSDLGDDHVSGIRQALGGLATVSVDKEPLHETVFWITPSATPEQLTLPHLKAVIVPWAGIPQTLRETLAGFPEVALYNIHHNANAAAEMAVGLLIAAARGIVDGDRRMREGHWYGRMDDRQGINLFGKRAAVLGYGAIGRRVGAVLEALGMEVVGIRRNPEQHADGHGDLDLVLPDCHALVVCAPLTPQTVGLIDAERLGLLRHPRLVVNVGRGAIIDESALFEACRSGTVQAAGIDTWYQYPQPGDHVAFPSKHPFQDLDNVVMSPHRAGDGDSVEALRQMALIELLVNLVRGDVVQPVDPKRGY